MRFQQFINESVKVTTLDDIAQKVADNFYEIHGSKSLRYARAFFGSIREEAEKAGIKVNVNKAVERVVELIRAKG